MYFPFRRIPTGSGFDSGFVATSGHRGYFVEGPEQPAVDISQVRD